MGKKRSPKEITHARLVKAAAAYLARSCRVVGTEFVATAVSESPDAVGWSGHGRSTVIECKTSRSDFKADKKKSHERLSLSVGSFRYYLTPPDLVTRDEVPEGWGLLEMTPSRHASGYFIKNVKIAPRRSLTLEVVQKEKLMLISLAGRALEASMKLRAVWLGEEAELVQELEGNLSGLAEKSDDVLP